VFKWLTVLAVLLVGAGCVALGRITSPDRRSVVQTTASTSPAETTVSTAAVATATQVFSVRSGPMETTIDIGDKVLVVTRFATLGRGDLVVFKKPAGDYSPGVTDLISRVIGLPGETISGQGGSVYINSVLLTETWLPTGTTTAPFPPTTIPAGHYFVMGDNRGNSSDSRVIGPIAANLVVGVAVEIVAPADRVTALGP
jgi:signal peptidase I